MAVTASVAVDLKAAFFCEQSSTMQNLFSIDVLAYFDPGSGSLLVQALVGGAAGLLVFAKFLWESASNLIRGRKPRDRIPADKFVAKAGSHSSRR
jgi:hypothetical protein